MSETKKLEPGTIVYFKRFKTSTKKGSLEIEVQGHCAGVVLGHVAPFVPDIPAEHALRIMGSAGFISFDDVIKFAGPEVGAHVVKRFKEVYHGVTENVAEAIANDVVEETRGTSKILNAHGTPIPLPPKQNGRGDIN
jgi:hypothetical protein